VPVEASSTAAPGRAGVCPPAIQAGRVGSKWRRGGPNGVIDQSGGQSSKAARSLAVLSAPPRTNIPEDLTSFIGRKTELSALRKLSKVSRLTSLIGPGGIGKTRLAIHLGRSMGKQWPDGIWWVDLAPIEDDRRVAAAIATSLHLPGGGPPLQRVKAWLKSRKALLILDNCEHLIADCAEFCRAILDSSPGLSIFVTSREPLGIAGEARFPIASLGVADALRLFEERGRLVVPGFAVWAANRDVVDRICRKLDGLPLAIELVAPRLRMMTEREILAHLDSEIGILATQRSADPRHQTMTATIDWSHRLLTESERVLFRRLSVFRGGFTLESAQAICTDQVLAAVIGPLGGLVEKSMVVPEKLDDGGTRFRLLQLQAEYAAEKLRAESEQAAFQRRHYEFFLDALEARAGGLIGAWTRVAGVAQATWKRRELANLWAAMRWARANSEEFGLEIAGLLVSDPLLEATQLRSWILELLDQLPQDRPIKSSSHPDEDPLFLAINGAALLSELQGDTRGSLDLARRAVDLASLDHTPNSKERQALALNQLASGLMQLGRLDDAQLALERAMAVVGDSDNPRLLAWLHDSLGWLALYQGRFEAARESLGRAAALSDAKVPTLQLARVLLGLANAELACGDIDGAERSWRTSLSIARALGGPFNSLEGLAGLVRIAAVRGDHFRAIRLAAAHQRASQELSGESERYPRDQLGSSIDLSRAHLGPRRSDQAWSVGLKMDLDQAMEYALEETDGTERVAPHGPLSRREFDVVRLLAGGLTNREIAEKLFLSERTVEGHLDRIRNKLALRSKTEIATWAIESGVLETDVSRRRLS
jgi:predicted ATPase/DNA-binding CsgD family transcriptional regulator